jgi:hypothetical protein
MKADRNPQGSRALRTLSQLSAGRPLWAVLDGAHDDRISHWVRTGDMPWACLWAGEIPRELTEVAPHAVRLQDGGDGSVRLMEHGWGRTWGIYMASRAPLADLRRHLRRYLRVQTEDGQKRMLFRFYDPRVLRRYLPTCTPRELEQFFGPAEAFFLETPEADGFEVWTLQNRKLHIERAPLA